MMGIGMIYYCGYLHFSGLSGAAHYGSSRSA